VELVPPFSIGRAVPEYVRARVPLVVTGLPLTVKMLGAVRPTLDTVPSPVVCRFVSPLARSVMEMLPFEDTRFMAL
jgi:hypothetical protein